MGMGMTISSDSMHVCLQQPQRGGGDRNAQYISLKYFQKCFLNIFFRVFYECIQLADLWIGLYNITWNIRAKHENLNLSKMRSYLNFLKSFLWIYSIGCRDFWIGLYSITWNIGRCSPWKITLLLVLLSL